MSEQTWMREICGLCPYSRTNTLWLHPERAEDFAYNAQNPYNDFPCHKTADLVEDDEEGSSYVFGRKSLTCCGFLSLQVNENGNAPEGFEPSPDAFSEAWEMIDHHTEHWDDEQERRRAKAIEAGTAETVKQGSVRRTKARSATPICPNTTAPKDAAA